MLFLLIAGVIVPAFHLVDPAAPGNIPVIVAARQRITGAPAGNINIKGSIGKFVILSHIENLLLHHEALIFSPFIQNLMDTPHAFVGKAVVQVQNSDPYCGIFTTNHAAKVVRNQKMRKKENIKLREMGKVEEFSTLSPFPAVKSRLLLIKLIKQQTECTVWLRPEGDFRTEGVQFTGAYFSPERGYAVQEVFLSPCPATT